MITLPNYEMRSMRETSQKMRELKSLHFMRIDPCFAVSLYLVVWWVGCVSACAPTESFFPADQMYNWHIYQSTEACRLLRLYETNRSMYVQATMIKYTRKNFSIEGMQSTWMNGWIVVDAAVFLRVFILTFDAADIAVSNMTDLAPLGRCTWWR